jgi:arsenate reductase (thioredoxin)
VIMRPKFRVLFLCTATPTAVFLPNISSAQWLAIALRSIAVAKRQRAKSTRSSSKFFAETVKSTQLAPCKSWYDFTDIHFDFVITVCDDAVERSSVFPGTPVTAHWSIPDPMAFEGSDEENYQRFLQAAFHVKRRVELLNCLPIEKLDHLQREVQTRQIQEDARH